MRSVLRGITVLLLLTATTLWAKDRLLPNDPSVHLRATRTVDFADGQHATLKGTFHALTGAPVQVQGGFEGERIASPTDPQALLRFVGDHPAQFRVALSDLVVLTSGTARHKSYLTARQTIEGRPVLGTRVQLRVGRSGRVLLWGADVVESADVRWQANLSAAVAAQALKAALDCPAADVVRTTEVWYRRGADLRPAYAVRLGQAKALRQPSGIIDALTGAVVASEDGIWDATLSGQLQGSVLPFNPLNPTQVRPLTNATVRLDTPATAILTDSAGAFVITDLATGEYPVHFTLEGPYVSLQNVQIDIMDFEITPNPFHCDSVCTAPDTVQYLIAPEADSVTLGAVNTWAHVGVSRDWWAAMDPTLDIVNTTLYIFPDQTDPYLATNAGFIAPWPPYIPVPLLVFGAGDDEEYGNFGYCADVIYHEYAHAVTNQFYPGDPEGGYTEMEGAMHEGFSDYFACTLTENPHMGQGLFIEYPDSAFRSLLNDYTYPEDWEGEGHWDGQIISAAMWEARTALGEDVVDTLFHYARYGSPEDFDAYYQEILIEDDDDEDLTNGTPHEVELWTAFHRHGIGPDSVSAVQPEKPVAALPQTPRLVGLYPNPFNPTTTVQYSLPQTATVTFTVHDVLGREVERVVLEHMSAGEHSRSFDLSHAASGLYFIGMHTGDLTQTAKAVLMK